MIESNKRLKKKKIIQDAMVGLLQDYSFDQISTVQLTKAAKISRSSFYTHYRDKYDMIDRYQDKLFKELDAIFEKYGDNKREAIIRVLKVLSQEELIRALLTENGTKEIQTFLRHKLQILLDEDLRQRYGYKSFSPLEEEYGSVYLSHAIFGALQFWIAKNCQESPEFVADFLIKMLFE